MQTVSAESNTHCSHRKQEYKPNLILNAMDGEFFTFVYPNTGDILIFCRTADGSMYSQVDDSFAHANGFRDLNHMQAQIYKDGGPTLPEWMLWHSESGIKGMKRLNRNGNTDYETK